MLQAHKPAQSIDVKFDFREIGAWYDENDLSRHAHFAFYKGDTRIGEYFFICHNCAMAYLDFLTIRKVVPANEWERLVKKVQESLGHRGVCKKSCYPHDMWLH